MFGYKLNNFRSPSAEIQNIQQLWDMEILHKRIIHPHEICKDHTAMNITHIGYCL